MQVKLHHSDAALKALLVEFVDHKLITYQGQSNKSTGNVVVHIDLDEQTLHYRTLSMGKRKTVVVES
jgi:hypothetical protein